MRPLAHIPKFRRTTLVTRICRREMPAGVRARCALANPVPVTLDKTVNLRDSVFGLADAQSMVDLNVALQSRRKPWENGFVSVLSG
jgi:hypothetical protein